MNSAVDGLVEDLSYHSHGVLRGSFYRTLSVWCWVISKGVKS